MCDQQLILLRGELETRLKGKEWGKQIQGAPQRVILMAHCKVLVSTPSAMALQLSGSGLKYNSLFANINHCNQIGQDTFRSTAVRMERVGHLSYEMSKSGGIIETMLKYMEPDQSEIRNKLFQSYIMAGVNSIEESVTLIRQVDEEFKVWVKVTVDLLRALDDKAASNQTRNRETEGKIKAQLLEKKLLEKELEVEKRELEDFEKRFQKAIRTYEHIVNSLPGTIASAGAMVAAATAVGLGPEVLAMVAAFGGMHHAWLWCRQQTRKSTIRSLENETSTLRDRLKQLSGEHQSIQEVVTIVKKTLQDLQQLQEQITHFMDFLMNIQTIMAIKIFKNDPDVKKEILSDALLMKNRFLIASKATALYNEVSQAFVIPGVHWVTGLCPIDLPDDVIEEKVQEIEIWKAKICNGAEKLISKRIGELDLELEVLNRESLQSFRKVAPELFAKVWEISNEDLK
ncbi:hypothetical protein B0I35DRAFT_517483 [Stachybotrys elegans]|uniref:Uncharacterized protein n=1 Tax=Stachybotrys elegans TaxID=80388 RepID=A0A8K0SCJ7_9HYPO|nr:hypothetical protein B0I35DRAFT_517483 [Stachybotrys elegans]